MSQENEQREKHENFSPYLFDFIKKKVDLANFLETEIGCNLKWYEPNKSAGTFCPLPGHTDKKASFRILKTDDNIWIFNCFGCNSKGTIIDFVREYYGLNSFAEAVLFICKKFGFKTNDGLVTDSLEDVKKKINLQKKMECIHIVSSRQCHALLRKNFGKYSRWVGDAYKKMNKVLDEENYGESIDIIESIGFEASNKLGE